MNNSFFLFFLLVIIFVEICARRYSPQMQVNNVENHDKMIVVRQLNVASQHRGLLPSAAPEIPET